MILNIHGFASGGEGAKKQSIVKLFANEHKVLSPDLPPDPKKAMEQLSILIKEHRFEDIKIVGTSLGGFYALCLSYKSGVPAILVNPSTRPDETLERCLGINTNFKTGEEFEFKSSYLESLKEMRQEIKLEDINVDQVLVLLGTNDELIKPKYAMEYFKKFQIFEYDTDHRFSRFEEAFRDNEVIHHFLKP